ncbi:MAG: SIMPL domain-containing protein [Bdellovibrionales bacterium]
MTDKKCPYSHFGLILTCAFVMGGLVLSGFLIKQGLKQFRTADRVVTVKGLAERDVEANLAMWTLKTVATGNDLSIVKAESETRQKTILMYLESTGFGEGEISVHPLQVQDLLAQAYRPKDIERGRYIMTQQVSIRTHHMDKIDRGLAELNSLLKQNVTLSNMQQPTYIFTDLNAIKPEMLNEAVRNARASAHEFAKESGAKVGGIKRAYQGVFQINPRDPVRYVSEQNQRYKRVRVVSTVDFYIE